jgi:hypothetical protein
MSHSRSKIWVGIVSIGIILVAGLLLLGYLIGGSMYRAEAMQLFALLDRWSEAGKPEGAALSEFMRGRRQDLIATNQTVRIDAKMYVTQFALTNPNGTAGVAAFLITTNRQLIAIEKDGSARLASLKDRP